MSTRDDEADDRRTAVSGDGANDPDTVGPLYDPLPYRAPNRAATFTAPDAATTPDRTTGPVRARSLPSAFVIVGDRDNNDPDVPPRANDGAILSDEAVSDGEIQALGERIKDLYEQVTAELADSPHNEVQAIAWLRDARTDLLSTPRDYPSAEMRVARTETLLARVKFSRAEVTKHLGGLAGLNVIILVILGLLFVLDGAAGALLAGVSFLQPIPESLQTAQIAEVTDPNATVTTPPPDASETNISQPEQGDVFFPSVTLFFPPWLCVLAGGIGGALNALIALGNATKRHRYNPADNLDYQTNALKGGVLGGIMYYLILGGFVTLATTAGNSEAANLPARVQAASSPLFILLSFIAGLSQDGVIRLLRNIWESRTGQNAAAEAED